MRNIGYPANQRKALLNEIGHSDFDPSRSPIDWADKQCGILPPTTSEPPASISHFNVNRDPGFVNPRPRGAGRYPDEHDLRLSPHTPGVRDIGLSLVALHGVLVDGEGSGNPRELPYPSPPSPATPLDGTTVSMGADQYDYLQLTPLARVQFNVGPFNFDYVGLDASRLAIRLAGLANDQAQLYMQLDQFDPTAATTLPQPSGPGFSFANILGALHILPTMTPFPMPAMGNYGPFTTGWFGKLGLQTLHWDPAISSIRISNYQGYMNL